MTCAAPRQVAIFPGAGSFGGELRPLQRGFGRRATRVRYPGRFDDTRVESFQDLVDSCTEQVRDLDEPILLGHSFGAYVAFAVAVRLERAGRSPSMLVVLGATAPAGLDVSGFPDDTAESVREYLRRIDPTVLENPPTSEWDGLVVDAVRDDMRLLRQFDVRSGEVLQCPIAAVRGDTDPLASETDTRSWRYATSGDVTVHTFAGGHTDYIRSPAFVSWFGALSAGH